MTQVAEREEHRLDLEGMTCASCVSRIERKLNGLEGVEATVNFACKFEGADMEIGFNPNFVTDALKVVGTDEISLELTAPNRPGLLKGGPDFLYVIMPVNLQ